MRLFFTLALLSVLISHNTLAQITSPREPRSEEFHIQGALAAIPTLDISPVSLSKSAPKTSNGREPFAKVCNVGAPFMDLASQVSVDDGDIYRLCLRANGAFSIGLYFEDFYLADGCELYLYGIDPRFRIGAVTMETNNASRTLRTAQIPGDSVVVELFVPDGAVQSPFMISRLYYDFKDFFAGHNTLNKASISKGSVCSTQMDLPCYGDYGDFSAIMHAVLKYTYENDGYLYMCTGTLVNSTNCDSRPLILSAAHCICDDETAETATFYFNYRHTECYSNEMNFQTVSGADLVATAPQKPFTNTYGALSHSLYPTMDFSLLSLRQPIPANYQPYFAGISLSNTNAMSTVSCLHHPNGNPMKVSVSYGEPFIDSYPAEDPDCHYNPFVHWHISMWDVGTTEGGSSGSALLNQEMQIVGTLSGGYASCFSPVNDYFQMITASWNTYPGYENQLKHWIAPNSTLKSIPPYDPYFVANKLPKSHLTATCDPDSLVAHLSWEVRMPSLYRNDSDSIGVADGLITPRISITGNEYLTFRARAIGGKSSLWIGENIRQQRFHELEVVEVGEEWAEYSISLSSISSSNIYIKFMPADGAENDIVLSGIDISTVKHDEVEEITKYLLYCNGDPVLEFPAGTTSCDFDIPHGKSYSFYILNLYGDKLSAVENIVVLAPGYQDVNTEIHDISSPSFCQAPLLYPNPARGSVSLEFASDMQDVRLDLVDMQGRVCISESIGNVSANGKYDMGLPGISAGVYIIKVYVSSDETHSLKLIVY